MHIVIQLADNITASAERRVRAVAAATAASDINFNGDTIAVERGDYTCIAEGEHHSDAAALFATVEQAIDDDMGGVLWHIDGPYTLVPKAEGGFVKMTAAQLEAL